MTLSKNIYCPVTQKFKLFIEINMKFRQSLLKNNEQRDKLNLHEHNIVDRKNEFDFPIKLQG
jgi:methyltransferase-like protein